MTTTEPSAESTREPGDVADVGESSGLVNFRDVGGLPTGGGGTTRAGVLYRSAAVLSSAEAPPALTAWPPDVVVDLRGRSEWATAEDQDHPLVELGTTAYPMPMLDTEVSRMTLPEPRPGEPLLAGLYRQMLGNRGPQLAELVRHLGELDGPALVHCAAGKDRAGVVVAVLLRACDVTPEAIVADYQATLPHMPAIAARHSTGVARPMPAAGALPAELGDTPAPAIQVVLDELDAHPDGAAGWLAAHGLDRGDLRRWRERLLG